MADSIEVNENKMLADEERNFAQLTLKFNNSEMGKMENCTMYINNNCIFHSVNRSKKKDALAMN